MSDKPQPLTSYEAGMLDERAHQDALTRLAMSKHQEEVDALKDELARLRDQLTDMTNAQHVNERSLDEYARTVARLRGELAECEQWEDVQPYEETHLTRDDGDKYVLGVDSDGNLYLLNQKAGGIVLCCDSRDIRIQRRKESEEAGNDG